VTGWLLDTNILSELRRPKPEPKVHAFIEAQPLELLYISAVTLAEIRYGIELLPDAARRSELNDWLTHEVRPMFNNPRPLLPARERRAIRDSLMPFRITLPNEAWRGMDRVGRRPARGQASPCSDCAGRSL
jgi:predicted nucleic acid-binding protein